MITLEKTFVSGEGGYSADPLTYTQVARTETTAIYERSRNGKVFDYEVFRIRILPKGTKVFQTVTEDDEEKYPGSSQFGIIAWSHNKKARALKCYEELNKQLKDKADEAEQEEKAPKKTIAVPVGEFTVGEFAEANEIAYANAFLIVKGAIENGSVKFVREERRNAKGKPSKIYTKA